MKKEDENTTKTLKEADDTKTTNWETIPNATFYKFEKIGDSIEGLLIDKENSFSYGFGLYDIMTKSGERKRFHGSQQLDNMMLGVDIQDYIRVTLIDFQKLPKGELKIFNVERKK